MGKLIPLARTGDAKTDNEKKKQILEDYKYTKLQHEFCLDELQDIEERKRGLTRILTGMPHGTGRNIEDKWIELIEYSDETMDYLRNVDIALRDELIMIEEAVKELPRREQTLVTARYIRGMRFSEILKEMPFSERTMYSIHENALDLIELEE